MTRPTPILEDLLRRAALNPNDASTLRPLAKELIRQGWHRNHETPPHPDEDANLEHWQRTTKIVPPERIIDPSDSLPYLLSVIYYRSRSEQRIECRIERFVFPDPSNNQRERKPSITKRTYMCGPYQYSSYDDALELIEGQ